MLSNAELNFLYMLKTEKEFHMTRQGKEDIEYIMVLRWLENRIGDLERKNREHS
jgi:hypothetical protein